MRTRPCLLSFLLLAAPLLAGSTSIPPPKTTDQRIVFLGDSITYGGDYVADIACWLWGRGWTGEVINVGLPSETGCDLTEEENRPHLTRHGFGRPVLSERLQRVVDQTKPDILVACYGMNDSDPPVDDDRFRRYREGIERIRAAATGAGVKQLIFLTPPMHDAGPGQPSPSTKDAAIDRFSRWLLEQRAQGWLVVDLHGPMRAALEARRRENPTFAFAGDGVHPNAEGHLLMARQLIAAWGGPVDYTPAPALLGPMKQCMTLQRDAWLAQTGHQRPGLAKGLPVADAQAKVRQLEAGLPRP